MDAKNFLPTLLLPCVLVLDVYATQAEVDGVDFGNNRGEAAFDGLCGDPRFEDTEGFERMAEDASADDMFRDASDCSRAHRNGAIRLRTEDLDGIRFGANTSPWAFDYVCSDPRFETDPRVGEPGANLPPSDMGAVEHDATDCRRGHLAEEVWYLDDKLGIAFGNDRGLWANDGQCDDPRFEGTALPPALLRNNVRRDATDCRRALELGRVRYTRVENSEDVDFGDDGSRWAYDGECDDPRFEGPGMAQTTIAEGARHDATDCYRAYRGRTIELFRIENTEGIDFGNDSSRWAFDGECDDPRFEGDGMAGGSLEKADRGRDATDCARAYRAGTVDFMGR